MTNNNDNNQEQDSNSTQRPRKIRCGVLWRKLDKNQREYFTGELKLKNNNGEIEEFSIIVFENTKKDNNRYPDYEAFLRNRE